MPSNTRNLRHGSIQLRDGQTAVNTLALAIEEGNLSFSESRPGVLVKHRGGLDHWSKGEEVETSLSFTICFVEYGSKTTRAVVAAAAGGAVTGFSVRDFLVNEGGLLTSTEPRTDVFCCDVWFTISNPVSSGDENEILKFTDFKVESLQFSEAAPYNTIAISGRAKIVVPTSTRA